jgi:predicted GNAT superfamily acetyltransferase
VQSPAWDISFRSTVHADRLRFAEQPRTAVGFPGAGERDSTSHSHRTGLPERVVAGDEYQDVTVAYRLATRLSGQAEGGRGGAGGADT